jgi:ribosomal protein L40E
MRPPHPPPPPPPLIPTVRRCAFCGTDPIDSEKCRNCGAEQIVWVAKPDLRMRTIHKAGR